MQTLSIILLAVPAYLVMFGVAWTIQTPAGRTWADLSEGAAVRLLFGSLLWPASLCIYLGLTLGRTVRGWKARRAATAAPLPVAEVVE